MRHIKPQSGLLQTTPTQIGPEAFLGVAVGIGFRLSDPRILTHEATVWEALKLAPSSAPLPAPTYRKPRAEWLLMGHSVHPCVGAMVGGQVDWTSMIRLGSSAKTLSCASPALASPSGPLSARLATDHTLAARGGRGDNPVGSRALVPPLQLVGALGISPSSVAGTGPIGTEWPSRQQWMPDRPASVEDMARDGTHMGWPAALDRRYFQSAPPNQWSSRAAWNTGTEYELRGFGPHGQGFAGRLPALLPHVLCTRRDNETALHMPAVLQTVWFLPDHDLGVMWWTGDIPGKYFDDDEVAELLLAFHDAEDPVSSDVLLAFAERRKSLEDHDPELHADTLLMPTIERDWVWEVIVDSSDHPRFGMSTRSHADTCNRLAAQLEMLADASRRMRDAAAEQARLRPAETDRCDTAPPMRPRQDWRARLSSEPFEALDNEVIRDADLGRLQFNGRRFKALRFERCRLDATRWLDCRFEQVAFVDCSFETARFETCVWEGCSLKRCDFARAEWHADRVQTLMFDDCGVDGLLVTDGDWAQVSMIGCTGGAGRLQRLRIDSLVLSGAKLQDWHGRELTAQGLGLVRSQLHRLRFDACQLEKSSVVQSSLTASRWNRCTVRMGVFSAGSDLEDSQFADCLFQATSWNELQARAIDVQHCHFESFTAQRLAAAGSRWQRVVLDGANAMHADLTGASFEHCAMREVMLHGATLVDTRILGCNLADAKTAWTLTVSRPAWRENLEPGHLAFPRRQS